MESFIQTKLWQNTLAERQNDAQEQSRARLRVAYLTFRNRASQLADEIPLNLPYLTKHDITHLDALWWLADRIIGDDLLTREGHAFINPLEAFVLGCAFLIHDLAHSEAALQLPLSEIRSSRTYQDLFATIYKINLREDITESQHKEVLGAYLRETHATHALDLVKQHWTSPEGTQHFLLMDEELRGFLANSIGRLAASHHWPVSRLPDEFSFPVGSPPFSAVWRL